MNPLTAIHFGIAEWSSALDHLRAVQSTGATPVSEDVIADIEGEFLALVIIYLRRIGARIEWPNLRDQAHDVVRVSREYLTSHQDELEELLNRERREDGEGRQEDTRLGGTSPTSAPV